MRADLVKRVQALEKEDTDRCVLWIGAPDAGLAGWQVVPMSKGRYVDVWRQSDETDDQLQARAALAANKHRGVVVAFGMDAQGHTR